MKISAGIETGDLRTVGTKAKRLEDLGYDVITAPETQHDPFFPLLLAAEQTERIELGTGVCIAFPRSPMIMANICWDLANFSKGRFHLGMGTQVKGHNERRFSVPWSAPGPRLREYILALRAIFSNWKSGGKERLNFQGEHYTFTLMTPNWAPPPIDYPDIPIMIASVGAYMARLAGELCDGVLLHGFTTPTYIQRTSLPAVIEGRKKGGRTGPFEVTGGGFMATGATEEEVAKALEGVRTTISFYGSTRAYFGVWEAHDRTDLGQELFELSMRGEWAEMPKRVPDDVIEDFAVVGTYDTIVDKIRERYEGVTTQVSFPSEPLGTTDPDRLKEILGRLKQIKPAQV